MTGKERLRSSALVAALMLLVTLVAGLGNSRQAHQYEVGSAVVTAGAMGVHPPGLLDTRLHRGVEFGLGQRVPHNLGFPSQATGDQHPSVWARTLTGVLDRADRPQLHGQICLRGPPRSSV